MQFSDATKAFVTFSLTYQLFRANFFFKIFYSISSASYAF